MFEILLWESQGGDGDCVSGVCMSQVGGLSVHWSCPVWGNVSHSQSGSQMDREASSIARQAY